MAQNSPITSLDTTQALKRTYEEANDAIRVDVVAGTVDIGGTIELDISETDDSIQSAPFRGTLTDRSGAGAVTSAQVAAANSSRKYFFIQNLDSGIVIYVNFGAAATSTNSIKLTAGAAFVMEGNFVSTQAINVIAASGTPAYCAKEGS